VDISLLKAICRPYTYTVFFQVCILLELLGAGAVNGVTVSNCYICSVLLLTLLLLLLLLLLLYEENDMKWGNKTLKLCFICINTYQVQSATLGSGPYFWQPWILFTRGDSSISPTAPRDNSVLTARLRNRTWWHLGFPACCSKEHNTQSGGRMTCLLWWGRHYRPATAVCWSWVPRVCVVANTCSSHLKTQ
jgi:hypothetical protein